MINTIYKLSIVLLVATFIQSCTNSNSKTKAISEKPAQTEGCCASKIEAGNSAETGCCSTKNDATQIKAYYFHATRRCATCEAVETVTKESLKEFYGFSVSFTSINRDENKDNLMIEKYKISGQTLLIIKGDKVVNLTNDAFMNARTKPEKLKQKIKSTIDSML
ncbi:nitrophenyl compound nitroreductase subunit ArsF family protein [Saccharicrinis aurantiacus]|uniref:nitrophenyl compound nitroreductase subunit ArsF family protein n=1 Tax=Saccharicrinis aurantiacus TaxID=1849719 RepID=UPI0024938751|nr:nitrophenyl compound nitroreductase subunit ArsF family protein [Saccharicrinis aurantiacus]